MKLGGKVVVEGMGGEGSDWRGGNSGVDGIQKHYVHA